MKKHTKLFYRAIARIRAVGEKNGMVYLSRIKTAMGTGYTRAYNLHVELIEAGIIEKPNFADIDKKRTKGNIIWKNLSKFRVPRGITEKEKARVEEERS
ncbi:hypothetical protein HY383_03065 [Candidatus Daviesbacteria bacterium]|nr:hypothetical protein [Candidatus Daviesbacteria bacterium]